jgi:hypothetical protein
MMIVVMAFFVAYTTVVVLSCIPISTDWDQSVHGTCININLRVLATAAVNVGIDLLVVLLPMPVVRRLRLPAPQRLMVGAIFVLGLRYVQCTAFISPLDSHFLVFASCQVSVSTI